MWVERFGLCDWQVCPRVRAFRLPAYPGFNRGGALAQGLANSFSNIVGFRCHPHLVK